MKHIKHIGYLNIWNRKQNGYPDTLLEEMVLFRTKNGSIPRFIYGTPK